MNLTKMRELETAAITAADTLEQISNSYDGSAESSEKVRSATSDLLAKTAAAKDAQSAWRAIVDARAAEFRSALPDEESKEAARDDAKKGLTVSLADLFLGSKSFKDMQARFVGSGGTINDKARPEMDPVTGKRFRGKGVNGVSLKTILTGASNTSAGGLVVNQDSGLLVDLTPPRALTVRDMFAQGTTMSDTVEYVQMTRGTQTAAFVAEATSTGTGTKPEAGPITFERKTTPVETIAHWQPVTKRALADASQIRAIIENYLEQGLDEEVERQILYGDAASPNLKGLTGYTAGGAQVQVQGHVIGAALDLDELVAMFLKVRNNAKRQPDFLLINPADFYTPDLALKKDSTGRFIYADPTSSPEAIGFWGLRTVVSDVVTAGAPIVGSSRWGMVWDREETTMTLFDQHADFAIKNLVAILAEERLAFALIDPQAFVVASAA